VPTTDVLRGGKLRLGREEGAGLGGETARDRTFSPNSRLEGVAKKKPRLVKKKKRKRGERFSLERIPVSRREMRKDFPRGKLNCLKGQKAEEGSG